MGQLHLSAKRLILLDTRTDSTLPLETPPWIRSSKQPEWSFHTSDDLVLDYVFFLCLIDSPVTLVPYTEVRFITPNSQCKHMIVHSVFPHFYWLIYPLNLLSEGELLKFTKCDLRYRNLELVLSFVLVCELVPCISAFEFILTISSVKLQVPFFKPNS